MYQVNKGINIDYAETLIKDFLAEGYNLYDIVDIMQIPLRQILDILTRRINWILRFAEKIEYSGLQNNCGFKTTVCANYTSIIEPVSSFFV